MDFIISAPLARKEFKIVTEFSKILEYSNLKKKISPISKKKSLCGLLANSSRHTCSKLYGDLNQVLFTVEFQPVTWTQYHVFFVLTGEPRTRKAETFKKNASEKGKLSPNLLCQPKTVLE